MFKTSKCFEGHAALLLWAVSASREGHLAKFFLVADAQQKSFGVRAQAKRGDDLKPNGAVVNLVRKHAPNGAIGRPFRDPASGHIWLPLLVSRQEQPAFWVQLAAGTPPELRFIDASGTVLVRKSSQGTFTKRWSLGGGLPAYPPAAGMEDLEVLPPAPEAAAAVVAEAAGGPAPSVLPEYQRHARDRLVRRRKTVRKALQKAEDQSRLNTAALAAEEAAHLLQTCLHTIKPGQESVVVPAAASGLERELRIALDPRQSPGQNLSALFARAKKARRGQTLLAAQVAAAAAELADLDASVEHLRQQALPLAAVTALLQQHGLAAGRDGVVSPADAAKVPYRVVRWRESPDATRSVPLLVGKSAADSDALVRSAKGNDWWIHVVGSTGSHVILPARELRGPPPPGLLRAAAILALHFSKLRTDQAGEVYITRRQHLKKRKGMAPGLWQVEQATTLFCRYDTDELRTVLDFASQTTQEAR